MAKPEARAGLWKADPADGAGQNREKGNFPPQKKPSKGENTIRHLSR